MENCGHNPFFERTEQSIKYIKSFIKLTEDIEIMLIKYYQKYLDDNEEIIRKHFLNIIDSKDFFHLMFRQLTQ